MSITSTQSRFLRRFDDVWVRMRRVQLLKAISVGALIWLVGFTALVVIDHALEPVHTIRLFGLAIVCAAAIAYTGWTLIRSVVSWTAPNTAAEIERSFPELGQSVRTAIQYGRMNDAEVESQGVVSSLAAALQQHTDRQTLPLDLPAIVRTGTLTAAIAGLCFLLGGLLTGSVLDWEWQTAVRRALLADIPYTTLSVEPAGMTVDEGHSTALNVAVTGRTDRNVQLQTRLLNDETADWVTQYLTDDAVMESAKNRDHYSVAVNDIRRPFEYRFSAGPASSEIHRVDVRYPLRMHSITADLTPPEYTGLPMATVEGGDISAIEGSTGVFRFVLDRAPETATLLLTTAGRTKADDVTTEVPLNVDGTTLTVALPLNDSLTYSVSATAADGTALPEKQYRVRIRRDQAPRVWFEEPAADLEVHTLAEVLMRIRTTDDFGLSNAGIVFEINNEQEHRLAYEDFTAALAELEHDGSPNPLEEVVADGATALEGHLTDGATRAELRRSEQRTPETKAALEKVLPLEFFELTQRDSVTYYAFATDNRPGEPHRTETDLRFIDIKPFRRQYQVIDPEDNPRGMPGDERVMFLDELIHRQRTLLNRTMRVAKQAARDVPPDTGTVDRLVDEQQTIADGTVRLADFLVSRNIGGEELLFEAQSVMLTVIDSLSVAEFDNAVIQEKDAVRLLVEGRETLRLLLLKNPRAARAALQAFSRQQTQKLRRPKSDEEELAEIVERLKRLRAGEQQVASLLASLGMGGSGGSGRGDAGQGVAKPPEPDSAESATESESRRTGDADADAANGTTGSETEPAEEEKSPGEDNGEVSDDAAASSGEPVETLPERRQRAEDRQYDIALEAHDIDAKMQNLDMLTDLARERMTFAAATAEEAAGALSRGDTDKAAESAKLAEAQFGELAAQVEALLAAEIADRIAKARDMANRLAQQQQQLTAQLQNRQGRNGNGGQSGQSDQTDPSDPSQGSAADQQDEQDALAQRLAESARTLQDLLNTIAAAERPEDQDAAANVARLMEELKTNELIQAIENLPTELAEQPPTELQVTIDDLSDRLELTAHQLGQIHRMIVAPRIERLMQTERLAASLLRQLSELETKSDVAGWHRDARELLEDLEKNGFGGPAVDELEDVLREGGWGMDDQVLQANWAVGGGGTYLPPKHYVITTADLVRELQARIQELVLGDLLADGDEATPVEYERMVERYYQVLSSEPE